MRAGAAPRWPRRVAMATGPRLAAGDGAQQGSPRIPRCPFLFWGGLLLFWVLFNPGEKNKNKKTTSFTSFCFVLMCRVRSRTVTSFSVNHLVPLAFIHKPCLFMTNIIEDNILQTDNVASTLQVELHSHKVRVTKS